MSQKTACIYVEEMESPIGQLTIACVDDGLCSLSFGSVKDSAPAIQYWARKNMMHGRLHENPDVTHNVIQQLEEYFLGIRRRFDIKMALKGTPFQKKVWESLTQIGYGETKTYKEIAQHIGNPKAVRAVGSANNKNPVPIIVPCHRVIGSSGGLIGYGGGLDKKQHLLQLEHVI